MKEKMKKCEVRGCRTKVDNLSARSCSIGCAIKLVEQDALDKVKAEKDAWRVEKKRRKEKLMTLRDWENKLQVLFNKAIRLCDNGDSCISCGRKTGCKMNAGHYISVGSCNGLRFCEDNVHLQCEHCNSYLGGNQSQYRVNLIEKIGVDRVEWLDSEHCFSGRSIDCVKEMIAVYKKTIKTITT